MNHHHDHTPSFWERARSDPHRTALIVPDGTAWTAGELLDRCDSISQRLVDLGVQPGDAVAVAAASHPDTFGVILAVTQLGAYYVPVSNRSTFDELDYVLGNCAARFLFAEPAVVERAPRLTEIPGLLTVVLGASGRTAGVSSSGAVATIDEFVGSTDLPVSFDRRCGQIMPYTSGTTGYPKGVRRPLPAVGPDEYWGVSSTASLATLRMQHDDGVHLVVSPLYHTAIVNLATSALHDGQRIVIRDRFEPSDVLRTIEEYRVTSAHMVPTMFHRLLAVDDPERRVRDLTSVRTLLHGAAPCPPVVKQRMIEWLGPVVCEYYGASEGGGTFVTAEEWLERPGTVGRPYPGAEVHILDDDGSSVPSGEVGRVFLKPVGQLFEYHGDPEKTSRSRIGGLITAGDLGYVDDDGYLFLSGRASDLVITGGVNVYPAEVEDALFSYPGLADATVVGLPDDEWGEVVVAIVELRPGWTASVDTAAELRAHCGGRLARHKLPKRIEFVDRLPREPNGKIRKAQLVERYRVPPTDGG
ncbi:MAG: AMP-binding protein [Ilumatobacter sp.]|uniref:AMP-binding protein n=1 Tax=Ilumatobacter sp. TaxID=1967498 RepID=UPI003918C805